MPTIQNVVKNEICVGCGACSVVTNGAISVHKGEYGSFVADLTNVEPALLETGSRVCPFADEAPDEDTVADRVINEAPLSDPRVGKYRFIHAGRVASDDYLNDSSSGGLTSWLVGKLLENGLVDGVIHVGRTGEDLFSYSVSRTPDQLRAKRKSAYYSTTLSEVLTEIRGDGLRYALVGVPCFVKAARLVCLEDATLSEQLKFFVGLVCGHLKSAAFAEFLAWQCGVAPAEVGAVDFRVKARGRDAGRYDFGVLKKGAVEWVTRPT